MSKKTIPWRLDPGQIEVVDEDIAAILRQKTPAERIALASDAHCTARILINVRVRALHPDWTEAQVQREVSRRLTRETN